MIHFITNAGRVLHLQEQEHDADWRSAIPTHSAGDIPVSEMPGSIHGSVFGFWIGDRSPYDDDVIHQITRFIDDHDVVGIRYLQAEPSDSRLGGRNN